MSLNLCIDIDGTITDAYYWLDLANNYFGTNIRPSQLTEYEIYKALKISREEYDQFYNRFGKQMHGNEKLRENAELILWRLNQEHNISYVTARENKMREVTELWFSENNLPKDKLYMLGSHYKVEKAKELDCNVFIEDRYENALQLSLAGFEVLLMDCYYNRLPLIPGITRVYNWMDVYEEIQEIDAKINKKTTKIA